MLYLEKEMSKPLSKQFKAFINSIKKDNFSVPNKATLASYPEFEWFNTKVAEHSHPIKGVRNDINKAFLALIAKQTMAYSGETSRGYSVYEGAIERDGKIAIAVVPSGLDCIPEPVKMMSAICHSRIVSDSIVKRFLVGWDKGFNRDKTALNQLSADAVAVTRLVIEDAIADKENLIIVCTQDNLTKYQNVLAEKGAEASLHVMNDTVGYNVMTAVDIMEKTGRYIELYEITSPDIPDANADSLWVDGDLVKMNDKFRSTDEGASISRANYERQIDKYIAPMIHRVSDAFDKLVETMDKDMHEHDEYEI